MKGTGDENVPSKLPLGSGHVYPAQPRPHTAYPQRIQAPDTVRVQRAEDWR